MVFCPWCWYSYFAEIGSPDLTNGHRCLPWKPLSVTLILSLSFFLSYFAISYLFYVFTCLLPIFPCRIQTLGAEKFSDLLAVVLFPLPLVYGKLHNHLLNKWVNEGMKYQHSELLLCFCARLSWGLMYAGFIFIMATLMALIVTSAQVVVLTGFMVVFALFLLYGLSLVSWWI